jgi:hypothetical protein
MISKIIISTCFAFLFIFEIQGQGIPIQYYITMNGNFYLPGDNDAKGTYPLLWYDKSEDPKFQIGGFGLGCTAFRKVNEKITWKFQANVSKHKYWEATEFRDGVNQLLARYSVPTSDVTFGLMAGIHYHVSEKVSAGSGISTHLLLVSYSKDNSFPNDEKRIIHNKYYKPVIPLVPLEVSLLLGKTLLNIRYEYALLNRYRGDLSDSAKEKYSVLTFEIGYRVR